MKPKHQYYDEEYIINSDGGLDIYIEYINDSYCGCSSCFHTIDFSLPKEEFAELIRQWREVHESS